MRRSTGNPVACCRCKRPTQEPRKGLCQRCYLAAYTGRTVAAACECCSVADPRVLVRRRIGEAMSTVCGNCAAVLGRRPLTLEALRAEVRPASDRRQADRRSVADRRAMLDVQRMLDEDRRAYTGRRAADGSQAAQAAL